MRAIWCGWRRGLPAQTLPWKCWSMAPNAISRSGIARGCIRDSTPKPPIDWVGHEGPAELGKVEAVLSALDRAGAKNNAGRRPRLRQTLAGALISLIDSRIR